MCTRRGGLEHAAIALALSATALAGGVDSPALRRYVDSLAAAAAPLSPAQSVAFLAEPTGDPGVKSLADQLRSVAPYLAEEDLSLAAAARAPRALTLSSSRGHFRGGLAVWQDDVFPIDHFVRSFETGQGPARGPRGALTRALTQPWFGWNRGTGGLVFRPSGADERLLEMLVASLPVGAATISLHRGTTAYEARLLELLAAPRDRPIEPNWRRKLETARQELLDHSRHMVQAWQSLVEDGTVPHSELELRSERDRTLAAWARESSEQADRAAGNSSDVHAYLAGSLAKLLRTSRFLGEFVTPDRERARLFAKGNVVSFAVRPAELCALRARGRLYVGLEKIGDHPAIELGLLAEEGEELQLVELLVRCFAGAALAGRSELFN